MPSLERLQELASKEQDRAARLSEKIAAADEAIIRDPDNAKAAQEVMTLERQLAGSRKALALTNAEIEAEKRRLYEREVKEARGKIADIEKRLEKIREAETAKMQAFYTAYQEWQDLVIEHEKTAQKYGLTVSSVMSLDQGRGGMTLIKYALDQWQREVAAMKVREQAMKGN